MYVELTPEMGEWINDTAEQLGCDYGPVIGVLLSVGLEHFGRDTQQPRLHHLAAKQFLLSAGLAGYRSELMALWERSEQK